MKIVIVGHVDHGKSTLVGRLLSDAGGIPKQKMEMVMENCRRNSKPFEYAFLLDALKEEQSQGITIDAARCFFKSRKRSYLIFDAPGHIEFLKNMVTGAARAEAALLVIDAKEGIRENSKRHGYLLSMIGIRQVAVCVNKMDLVDYREKVFRKIERDYRAFLSKIGLKAAYFIPIAAREGDNMVKASGRMKWYRGPSILEALDSFEKTPPAENLPLRMPVQGVYKFTQFKDARRIIAGRIESGSLQVGDPVIFYPSLKKTVISSIEEFSAPARKTVTSGCCPGVTLKEQIYISRGEIMCRASEKPPAVGTLIRARIFWMGHQPMVQGREYKLKICTMEVPVTLRAVEKVTDASNLKSAPKNRIERFDVATAVLECFYPIAFDLDPALEATSRFVIVDHYDIAGGGIVGGLIEDDQSQVRSQVMRRDLRWDNSLIDPNERSTAYGHVPQLVLVTGKYGIDKRSIAKRLEKKLFGMGKKVYFLGIGNLLRGLDSDLSKDRTAKGEHVRRLGEVAHILLDAGLLVLATASDLEEEDLKMLKEVAPREAVCIVNMGKTGFRKGVVDFELPARQKPAASAEKILSFLEAKNLFISRENA